MLAIVTAARLYIDRQWYVGESGGYVAVYQGIPARVAGLRLSHIELETDIPSADVAQLPQYPELSSGITASDRTEAFAIVEQIRSDVKAAAIGSGT